MSISLECAKEHANDPAVLCCRAEDGVVLSSHNLEDAARGEGSGAWIRFCCCKTPWTWARRC